MSRVIKVDNPTKVRNQHRRTIAEILRRLTQKPQIDDEAKDMAAAIVYLLREIHQGVDASARAWEKRDYWIKVEQFRQKWEWTGQMADELENLLLSGSWRELPQLMVKLLPYFSDITVNKFTRKPSLWRGCYEKLVAEHETS